MSKIDHVASLRELSDWLVTHDHDMKLPDICKDPADAADLIASQAERIQKLEEALQNLLPYVATQSVGCHGYKCREPWCWSCNDDDEAILEAAKGSDAYKAARTALEEKP